MLVVIVACIAALGAWTDRPRITIAHAPRVVRASEPWDAIAEISRRGRRLDGFRPVFEVTDPQGGTQTVPAHEVAPGRYRVSLVFPQSGFYA
jgi:hypothetical protein